MTGGVTTTIWTNKILSREKLWQDLLNANKEFVIAAVISSPPRTGTHVKRGLLDRHSYSVLRATEKTDEVGNKVRLVLIRNPWGGRNPEGMGEWNGAWSDGSKEWTPYWMQKLNYRFGDDGLFWISFDDMLRNFTYLNRTRVFGKEWNIAQQWVSVNVSWVTGYLNTKFSVEIKKSGLVVIVLSQLDTRYFFGLKGQYEFELHFLLQEEDAPAGEHVVRARRSSFVGARSVSAEVELEAGRYEVLPKILAFRISGRDAVEDVVKMVAEKKPQKLRQIGLNYDLAHMKGYSESEDRKSIGKAKTKEAQKSPDEKIQEQLERETEQGEGKGEEKPEVKREEKQLETEEQPQGENEALSVPAATTSAQTSASATNEPTPASTASQSIMASSPQERVQTSEKLIEEEDASEPPPAPAPPAEPDETSPQATRSTPWNAICAIGLLVYSKDANVSIKLTKPRDAEEGAALDIDGVNQAGATM